MKKTVLLIVIMLVTMTISAQEQTVRLSDMEIGKAVQSYAHAMRNRAVNGEPLAVAGVGYDDGVGVMAHNLIKINSAGKALRFTAIVGVNDNAKNYKAANINRIPMTDGTMVFYEVDGESKQFIGIGRGDGSVELGSVVFRVVGDGRELYNSGVVRAGDKPRNIDIDIVGVKTLELITEEADDGPSGDHADWINAGITYRDVAPQIVDALRANGAEPLDEALVKRLTDKITKLPHTALPIPRPDYDWLIDNSKARAAVMQTNDGKDIVLGNGLISRVFRVMPNVATVDFVNHITGQSLLRAVSSEGVVVVDGKSYPLGGLDGQFEYGYTQYKWIDSLTANAEAFRITDFTIGELKEHVKWANRRWSLAGKWNATGKVLTFDLEGVGVLRNMKVKLNYALYDGLPVINKWIEIENHTGMALNLDSFVVEQLAMAEPESPVESQRAEQFRKPNIHVESDWAFLGFTEKEADRTEVWSVDPRYTSQCNYPMVTPCLLEVKLPMGPDVSIPNGGSFTSFRTWLMPLEGEDREKNGLYQRRFYATVAPWLTENPIFMHCTSSDPQIVREAIDQCAETGYEMIILSFGSGLNMEDESEENYAKFRSLVDYANAKGIELGGYSLLSSRWISDEVDVINPQTGTRGGMIFGSSPCLSSDWGYEYFRKIKKFYEKTGMSVFENDGSYPGNVCASDSHAHHKGLQDSQWEQRKQIESLYKWMCESGIYTNVPDFGYVLNGSTKVGIGYREVNWSLPRERQLILGRQVMYDGLWERMPSMCWTFVPLTQYHGGGEAATLEPLSEHLDHYKAHMIQNYGTGVQACYRGHRLYDTEQTKQVVKEVIDWYKANREILNSDLIHLRRPDGRDYDAVMHVNPKLETKALALIYNPLDVEITRSIKLPLYYTGLTDTARVSVGDAQEEEYPLDRDYSITLTVTVEANSYALVTVK